MSEFKPLSMQRAIRDDTALKKAEKALLWAAVLRTDNRTRKVRASLELLAKDAGYHPNTAKTIFRDDNETVMRYFEKVERSRRSVNLWFHGTLDNPTSMPSPGGSESTVAVRSTDVWALAAESTALPGAGDRTTTLSRESNHCAPSAFTSADSASRGPRFSRPSDFAVEPDDDQAQDFATPAGPLPDEPLSQASTTPAEEREGTKPCDCIVGLSCPECRGDVPVPSKYSEAKLKEFHDRRLGEEGLNEYGEPLGLDY